MSLTPSEELINLLLTAARRRVLRKAVFSKSRIPSTVRTVATLRHIAKRDCIQLETFHKDNKVTHENLPLDDAESAERLSALASECGQVNLLTTVGECEFRSSKNGKSVLLGGGRLASTLGSAEEEDRELPGNNREKQYILSGQEEFLRLLGISDKSGRIHDKKQSKYRQINRFLEQIRDVRAYLPTEEITVADLCCGKSYLTFAAYYYLSEILGLNVKMFGADLKPDVIAYCSDTARTLGFDGLSFLCTDIRAYTPPEKPHLVISLHACDTATDIVLDKATEWGADVILSTPCCHHELNHSIVCPPLSFITEHSMLRQKLCDAATDALRLKRLEAAGYRTEALELIDPEETPKNILLRAVRRKDFRADSPEARRLSEEYRVAREFLLGKKISLI